MFEKRERNILTVCVINPCHSFYSPPLRKALMVWVNPNPFKLPLRLYKGRKLYCATSNSLRLKLCIGVGFRDIRENLPRQCSLSIKTFDSHTCHIWSFWCVAWHTELIWWLYKSPFWRAHSFQPVWRLKGYSEGDPWFSCIYVCGSLEEKRRGFNFFFLNYARTFSVSFTLIKSPSARPKNNFLRQLKGFLA